MERNKLNDKKKKTFISSIPYIIIYKIDNKIFYRYTICRFIIYLKEIFYISTIVLYEIFQNQEPLNKFWK